MSNMSEYLPVIFVVSVFAILFSIIGVAVLLGRQTMKRDHERLYRRRRRYAPIVSHTWSSNIPPPTLQKPIPRSSSDNVIRLSERNQK
jgi:hypothetical protein